MIPRMRYLNNAYHAAKAWKQSSHNVDWVVANKELSEQILFFEKVEKGEITAIYTGDPFVTGFCLQVSDGKRHRNPNQG